MLSGRTIGAAALGDAGGREEAAAWGGSDPRAPLEPSRRVRAQRETGDRRVTPQR